MEFSDKHIINKKHIDYDNIIQNCFISTKENFKHYDVSFIITAKDRVEFAEILYLYYLQALGKFPGKVSFTIVEHSERKKHWNYFCNKTVNYIHIPFNEEVFNFNKCLAYNIGAFISNNCDYYILHDLDILMDQNFFVAIFENILEKGYKALQNYTKNRVLHCDELLTQKLLSGKIPVNILNENYEGIKIPNLGSTGGSITIEKQLFFDAGGYDPELFNLNSPEDQFFWEKILSLTEIGYAHYHPIELFHMWHNPEYNNPHIDYMNSIVDDFKKLSKEEKLYFIKIKKELIKKYA